MKTIILKVNLPFEIYKKHIKIFLSHIIRKILYQVLLRVISIFIKFLFLVCFETTKSAMGTCHMC